MDIEEKQAIKMMKFYQEEYRKQIKTLKENGEPEGYGTTIDTIKGRICNIQLVLNLIEKQESELEKKEAIINEMAKHIHLSGDYECLNKECEDDGDISCEDCIKEYFYKKVKETKDNGSTRNF